MVQETRITLRNAGKINPESIEDYIKTGGYEALKKARKTDQEVLIDEIENAGIDRINAVNLLSGGDKIVLLATHDPLLALSATKRINLCNGGIQSILERSEKEREKLKQLIEIDRMQNHLREVMRSGERME